MIDRTHFSIWFSAAGLLLLGLVAVLAASWKRSSNLAYVQSRLDEDALNVAADVRSRFALYEYG